MCGHRTPSKPGPTSAAAWRPPCTAGRWDLGAGICLVSGARQSSGAHALWHRLARQHTWGYVDLRDKAVTYLGQVVEPPVLDDLLVRMVLLGEGWTLERLRSAIRMR